MASLSIYLDASVIVPIFLPDTFVNRAREFLSKGPLGLIIGDFASTEFSSVVGIRVRTKDLTASSARAAFSNFDSWTRAKASGAETLSSDIRTANQFLRRLDLTLRAADAINIAVAQRLGAELATFDDRMAANARKLGVPVASI